jgi:RNA polymerase sigma-70 factor, ECF subfamily
MCTDGDTHTLNRRPSRCACHHHMAQSANTAQRANGTVPIYLLTIRGQRRLDHQGRGASPQPGSRGARLVLILSPSPGTIARLAEQDVGRLVEAARQGDRHAFASLYTRYVRLVHGVLFARVPRTEVDDLVQDVFVTAMQRMATLRDVGAFGSWLTTIARNRATDYLRRAPMTTDLPEDIPAVDRDHLAAVEILRLIRLLPDTYRETLVLRLVEGMTGPEIAAVTGLTAASVRVNLHRGMKLLRARLNGE